MHLAQLREFLADIRTEARAHGCSFAPQGTRSLGEKRGGSGRRGPGHMRPHRLDGRRYLRGLQGYDEDQLHKSKDGSRMQFKSWQQAGHMLKSQRDLLREDGWGMQDGGCRMELAKVRSPQSLGRDTTRNLILIQFRLSLPLPLSVPLS